MGSSRRLARGAAIAALGRVAAGYAYPQSEPTFTGVMPKGYGISPAPTADPLQGMAIAELFRRDPSKTCAYLYGHTDLGITCDPGLSCSTNANSIFHCCASTGTCFMPTACLDYTAYLSGYCSSQGSSTTCCSESTAKFCTAVALVDKPSVSLVGCFASKEYFPLYATPTDDTSTIPTPTPTPPSPTPTPPTPTPTPSPTDNGGGGAPVGAIVGGVVGGLAVISIVAAAIAFLIFRRRRNAAAENNQAAPPPVQQAPPAGGWGPAGGHQSYLAPVGAAGYDPRQSMAVKSPHESMYSSTLGSPVPGSEGPGSPGYVGGFAPQHQAQALQPQHTGMSNPSVSGTSPGPDGPGQQDVHPYYQPGQYVAELPERREE